MAGTHHGHAWRKIRATVLAQSDICWLCGSPGADTVDHVIEIKHGGTNELANLRPAHGKRRPEYGCRGNYSRSAGLRRGTPRSKKGAVSREWR